MQEAAENWQDQLLAQSQRIQCWLGSSETTSLVVTHPRILDRKKCRRQLATGDHHFDSGGMPLQALARN